MSLEKLIDGGALRGDRIIGNYGQDTRCTLDSYGYIRGSYGEHTGLSLDRGGLVRDRAGDPTGAFVQLDPHRP